MNMIEKVARALCKFDTGNDYSWENHKCQAEAAIAAMREPTEEMIIAAEPYNGRIVWKSMIDAALKE